MSTLPQPESRKSAFNPALIATIVIPAFAIAASVATVGVAVLYGDRELPEQYHWEGFRLDRDFALAERARELDVRIAFGRIGAGGTCSADLDLRGPASGTLTLRLTHATLPVHDRFVELRRVSASEHGALTHAHYAAACEALPEGHWRLEISDSQMGWSIRQSVAGTVNGLSIAARRPVESSP
jgi:hypothetical protein